MDATRVGLQPSSCKPFNYKFFWTTFSSINILFQGFNIFFNHNLKSPPQWLNSKHACVVWRKSEVQIVHVLQTVCHHFNK